MQTNGIIILYKESGITSQTAVNKIKRLLGTDKAGHTGTLDPLATGVLPILVGRGVKASEYLVTDGKHYGATLLLGITTDTEDVTGSTLTETDEIPEEKEVAAAIESMLGDSMQTPPMYSAIKKNGKKLCDLARDGITVEREPRKITISDISYERINEREYKIDVHCSKGTYIRTLCADIGAKLGVGGTMKTLERLSAGGYTVADAHTLSEIESMSEEERAALVLPIESIFSDLDAINLPPFYARLARCGVEIYLKKIGITAPIGKRFRLKDGEEFFALGEVREYEDGLAVKPIKQFLV